MPPSKRTNPPNGCRVRAAECRAAIFISLLAVSLALITSSPVPAHPLGSSYSQFVVGDATVQTLIRVPMDDLDLLLQLDRDLNNEISDAEIEQARAAIEAYLGGKIHIIADGRKLAPALGQTTRWYDKDGMLYLQASLTSRSERPIERISLQVEVLVDLYDTHKDEAHIQLADRSQEFVFAGGNHFEAEVSTRILPAVWKFFKLGVDSSFQGLQALFVLGILLAGSGFRNAFITVACFSAAQSIALAVATLGGVQLVPLKIEGGMALTTAYIGSENLFVKDVQDRWKFMLVFGLVHGFGLSGLLRDMRMSLAGTLAGVFSFDVGMFVGQMVLLSLMMPLLSYLEGIRCRKWVTRLGSLGVLAIGLFWFYRTL